MRLKKSVDKKRNRDEGFMITMNPFFNVVYIWKKKEKIHVKKFLTTNAC